jgi:hypothetical protein
LRATDLTLAVTLSLGGFCGVLAGVMSIPAPAVALLRLEWDSDFGAGERPRATAALAADSTVRVPEALREESIGGWRFF